MKRKSTPRIDNVTIVHIELIGLGALLHRSPVHMHKNTFLLPKTDFAHLSSPSLGPRCKQERSVAMPYSEMKNLVKYFI